MSLAKRGVSVCAATAGSTNFRSCPQAIAEYASFSMMLPQPQSLRGIVQRRPSHRSNYLALSVPSPVSFGLLHITLHCCPFQFRSYLSKYLILHMLNYHPIQREHHIFRGAGTGSTGQKVAVPEPLLETYSRGNDSVTERAGITGHNCRRFSGLTEVIELDGMDMQLHVL